MWITLKRFWVSEMTGTIESLKEKIKKHEYNKYVDLAANIKDNVDIMGKDTHIDSLSELFNFGKFDVHVTIRRMR